MRLEHWIYAFPLRVRSLFRRRQVERELDDELQYHLEQRTDAEIARGASPDDARRIAMLAMEGLEQRKEECRDMRRVNLIENLLRDVRYAARMLRKSPAFTTVAILSLALGIGANTAIFSLLDALLLRPLAVPRPDRLVNLILGEGQPYLTYPLFEGIHNRSSVFSGTFAWAGHEFQTTIGGEVVHVEGMLASGDYFTALGVPAAAGRTFTPADDKPDGGSDGPVAVIADSFWASRFQRNPSVIGKPLLLDGVRFTIAGVMPRGFFGAEVGSAPNIWVPLNMARRVDGPSCIESRSCWWLVIMARLRPDVSPEQAAANLKAIAPGIMRDTLPRDWKTADRDHYLHNQLRSLPGVNGWTFLRHQFSNPLAVLMTLVGLVLLIACANMANLLLARGAARHREIGVRLALGAGRWRVIRQLLTESVLLSVAGGAAGLLFSAWAARLLIAFLQSGDRPVLLDLHPDWRVLLFTAAAAIATGLLFGLAPALRATRLGIASALKERAHNLRPATPRFGAARLLLAAQVALSILLLAGAGLLAGSLIRLLTTNPGFDARELVVAGIDTDKRPEKGPELVSLYERLLERVRALPGVSSASILWMPPLTNSGWDDDISIPGKPPLPESERDTYMNLVAPRYFATMRTPVLAGREFNANDSEKSEPVGIITENAARLWFPNQNPIGGRVQLGKSLIRIVGVVRNARYLNLREPEPRTMYFPFTQGGPDVHSMSFVIRTSLPPGAIYPAFHAVLHEIAPGTPIGTIKSMDDQIAESLARERLMASLSVFFGVLALLLTGIGLYGILAYAVARRTGEIGIRMALGAQRRDVLWLVLRQTAGHVAIGVVAGIAGVLATSRLVASLLYGVRPTDPLTLAGAVLVLAAVAATAAWLPSRRASRLDPMAALREE